MTQNQYASEEQTPSQEFREQVKEVLEHLYDFPYLQTHPLVRDSQLVDQTGGVAGQSLRREVMAAIELLSPGPRVAFRSPNARVYNLLQLHYIEGMTIQEVAHELGISVRQAYRDLRQAEDSVAAILWARQTTTPQEPRAIHLSSVQREVARLETHPRSTDMGLLLRHAQKAVERLALQRSLTFQTEIALEPVIVASDPIMAQQVLTGVLSYIVQQVRTGGTVSLRLSAGRGTILLTARYPYVVTAARSSQMSAAVTQLAERLNWTIDERADVDGAQILALSMATSEPTILVIDDNAGLVELLERYLSDHACRVAAATNGDQGLSLAQELAPQAIVLDVMMPEMDGWEVLQMLRHYPRTSAIPVIICSVFDDPELAYSLGASLFLPKPVSRSDVLAALRHLGVV